MTRGQVRLLWLSIVVIAVMLWPTAALAQDELPLPLPRIQIGVDPAETPQETAQSLQILLLLTVLSLAPAILILMTSFTRIVIVLSFTRSALGTQQTPPNQVIVGLALFLTFFVMAPVWQAVNSDAVQPFLAGDISQQEALERGVEPVRQFMFRNTRQAELGLMVGLAGLPQPEGPDDVPTHVLIPAFAISELKTAFILGFVIYIPFIVIDMIVASSLMSMGMMMVPPVMISLPFKILLFVMVDGWQLLVRALVSGFN